MLDTIFLVQYMQINNMLKLGLEVQYPYQLTLMEWCPVHTLTYFFS